MTAATADTARDLAPPPGRPARSSSGGGRPWQRCSKRHARQRLHPALYVVVSCKCKQALELASQASGQCYQPFSCYAAGPGLWRKKGLSPHSYNVDLADC